MTVRVSYIGDAVTAHGLALVGVETQVVEPQPQAVREALALARGRADLVILNQQHADVITTNEIVHEAVVPPVVLLPSMDRRDALLDRVIAPARRELGLG